MLGLRASMPKRSTWRRAQIDTLRLHLIKIAARRRDEDKNSPAHANFVSPIRISCALRLPEFPA
jgi:hypothetical protein